MTAFNIHAGQNLRLAQKMLDQQGQINALTTALAEVTREFEDVCEFSGCGLMVASDDEAETYCVQPLDAPIHRTPAAVRAELEGS